MFLLLTHYPDLRFRDVAKPIIVNTEHVSTMQPKTSHKAYGEPQIEYTEIVVNDGLGGEGDPMASTICAVCDFESITTAMGRELVRVSRHEISPEAVAKAIAEHGELRPGSVIPIPSDAA